MKKELPEDVRKYLAQLASKGGKARAKKHSKQKLSKWAKLGGRPPKKGTNEKKK